MGNQMPARCMVPCNPICCATCLYEDAGTRENDSEHKTGSIFANAASVLSMAAEEITLDDHLEKELANEVELWRMETSSTAVHTNDNVYRQVFASTAGNSAGYSADHSADLPSELDLRNYGMESDLDDEYQDESIGDGRGFDNYACGSSKRQVPPGAREGTGLSNLSSGQEYSTGHSSITPVTESREQTAMSSYAGKEKTINSDVDSSSPGPAENLRTVHPQSPQPAIFEAPRDRNALGSLLGGVESSAVAANGTLSPSPEPAVLYAFPPEAGMAAASKIQAEAANEATLHESAIGSPPRDDTLVSLGVAADSASGGWLVTHPAEEELPNDAGSSSSSEESFEGFLEDPLEKGQAPPANPLSNFRYVPPWPSDLEAASPGFIVGESKQQTVLKPSTKTSLNSLEGVREDRSSF